MFETAIFAVGFGGIIGQTARPERRTDRKLLERITLRVWVLETDPVAFSPRQDDQRLRNHVIGGATPGHHGTRQEDGANERGGDYKRRYEIAVAAALRKTWQLTTHNR